MLLNQRVKAPQTDQEILDRINEIVDSDSRAAIPNGYSSAYIGLYYDEDLEDYRAVYSKQAMVRALMTEDRMSDEEAIEFLSHNTWSTNPPEGNAVLYIDEV